MGMKEMPYDPFMYWEARAPYWLAEDHSSPEWVEEITSRTDPKWSVLELGCGDGRWSEHFEDYTGSDVSSILLEEAQKRHPGKKFGHHDMRQSLTRHFDLIFTFTSWLHMPPEDIKKVSLPDTNYLFIEPHGIPNSAHCFRHDYAKLFGAKKVKTIGDLTMYERRKP